MFRPLRSPFLFVSFGALGISLAGCGDSGASTPSGTPAGGTNGGATGATSGVMAGGTTGGAAGGTAGGASGGTTATTGGTSSGTANGASSGQSSGDPPPECANPGQSPIDPTALPECPMCTGQAAHCLGKSVVMSVAPDQLSQLAECDADNVCVPDELITTMGNYDPPPCDSIGGGAGRCLSVCIGQVADMGDFLPQASCADGQKCAPCTDPRTGENTGACDLNCDTGPHEPSVVFDRCCEGDIGMCVPPDLVPETQRDALTQQTCPDGSLCAPEVLADSSYIPPTCTSVAGAEGRCLSTCVGMVADQADLLPQDTCPDGQLCAPCYDPRGGADTGACTLNGDMPTQDPIIFDTECCATTGLCVPSSAVPEKFSALLVQDNCGSEGADWVCAPKVKLNDINAKFQSCTPTVLGIPGMPGTGACIPDCIAEDQKMQGLNALGISQSDCPAGWQCAPCTNPLDMTSTGACD